MLRNLGYRMVSSLFCNMSRRQYKRIRNLLLLSILLVITLWSCVVHIDNVCGLDHRQLPDLPEEAQAAPAVAEKTEPAVPIYDIPLSRELQELTYRKCIEYDVDYVMALAVMEEESSFQADLVSAAGDYGLMQINESNIDYLTEALGTTNLLDPEQNIEAGIFWLSGIYKNYSDPNQILMVYNMGGSIAQALMDEGRESTWYSREVLRTMDDIRGKQVQI